MLRTPVPQSNRASRRAEAASAGRYRRKARDGLTTVLTEAGASLEGHLQETRLKRAIAAAHRDPRTLRCIVCAGGFTTEAPFAAFLLSYAIIKPSTASVSAICLECWRDRDITEIEAAAERVLSRVIPGGHFLDGFPERHDQQKDPLALEATSGS